MGNAFFIVWRETIEAMLVIGILHGWLSARPEARAGIPWLWGGVAVGLGLAAFWRWRSPASAPGLRRMRWIGFRRSCRCLPAA